MAYYGIQTNMGLYLKQYMGYPADTASQLLQIWKGTVYLTPLLGAFLADAYMGRFWVILVFSALCEYGWPPLLGRELLWCACAVCCGAVVRLAVKVAAAIANLLSQHLDPSPTTINHHHHNKNNAVDPIHHNNNHNQTFSGCWV